MTEGHADRIAAALGGTYRIERKLGEGGMASVYLAEDLKHERKVALKILRPELAAVIGGERFLSEIKTTANLQHPHILPLFDSGEADGYLYYVMPYIDGETLADKLARERQLGVEEAVNIARSVASALDYAHRHGVIHRDIKPANILLHDGNPIVADFGIALAVSAAGGGRMTETGLSLGTPHYMSPEQASADRDLSARSDVYSLGCVLYEMLAGQPPHTGPSAQNILIRILTERPQPLTALRHTVPPHVSAVVAKAIEKLPADRFDSASDFAQALDDASFEYTPAAPKTTAASVAAALPTPTPPSSTGWPRWVTAAAALLALGAGYAVTGLTTPEPTPAPSAAFTLVTDSTHRFSAQCCGRAVAISPEGDRIVYQATDVAGTDRLYQRPLGQRRATAIPGTEGGRHPFFSPDGEWLGFFDQGIGLKKVRFDGAAPLPLAPVSAPGLGAAWSESGDIYFSDRQRRGLWRVSEDGGEASPVAEPDTTVEFFIGWPAMLPGSDHVLITSLRENAAGQEIALVEVLDLASGVRRPLLENATDARYVEPGYVVFSDVAGSIMAQPLDLRTLEVTGERFRIADQAIVQDDVGSEYDISRNGTLVMLAARPRQQRSELVILDRAGTPEVLDVGRDATLPRFSPDGRYLAFSVSPDGGGPSDIWTWDLERGVPSRVTFEGDNSHPSWSPDGASILFQRWMDGEQHGYMARRDGTGTPARIIENEGRTPSMSSDERWLVWGTEPGGGGSRIWVKETGSEDERILLGGGFPEFQPAISPDGRWIAYVAEDDGDDQVYVQRFPELGPRVKISTEGGREPRWSADGSELFFRDYASGNVISVEVLPGDEVFEPGAFRELFSHGDFARAASATVWDVHPDGERFVFVRGDSDGGTGAFSLADRLVITNAVTRGR